MKNSFIISGVAPHADRFFGLAGVIIVGMGLATTAIEANKRHWASGPEFSQNNHPHQLPDFNKIGSGICLRFGK